MDQDEDVGADVSAADADAVQVAVVPEREHAAGVDLVVPDAVVAVVERGAPYRPVSRSARQAPPSLDHRYLHEDVGWGLVPWMELARGIDVATPTMGALTHLAGIVNTIDYEREGLTLGKMGLGGIPADEITEYVRNGRRPAS